VTALDDMLPHELKRLIVFVDIILFDGFWQPTNDDESLTIMGNAASTMNPDYSSLRLEEMKNIA